MQSHSTVKRPLSMLEQLPLKTLDQVLLQLGLYDLCALLKTCQQYSKWLPSKTRDKDYPSFMRDVWKRKYQRFQSSPFFQSRFYEYSLYPQNPVSELSLMVGVPSRVATFAVCIEEGAIERLQNNHLWKKEDYTLLMETMNTPIEEANPEFTLFNAILACSD